ncbi:MAG: phosphorylase, partial [Myxococcaceae bacterium]|nr:phosphorylase [Myxococcaceae bacterium]MCI0672678.1 phosphorylase [Myxococcaceae bacterium]
MSNRMRRSLLAAGDLWEQTVATTARALGSGDLQPLTTECTTVEDGGVQFQVRVLRRPPDAEQARAEKERPG